MSHILLIDDDPALIPSQVRQSFPAPTNRVDVALTGHDGLARIRADPPDAILLDLRLPDFSGLDLFRSIREIDARIPVIFVTVAKTTDTAIEAMQQGAFDYLFKPLDLRELRRIVGEAVEVTRRMREPTVTMDIPPDLDAEGVMVGSCPAMREVYKAIGRVAAQNVPVLITGESGTGKELVALAIYQHSDRARAPFLALNCAAIPENLLESELFGHERGAFTGADRRRVGKFEQCHGGTILLDEIGDMALALQAKILRLVQYQSFERVGGDEAVRTDVRLIAATNRDLKSMAGKETFRPDLYYRLSVFTIHLPPLRERGDDLQLLVKLYLRRFGNELGREVSEIAPDAWELLLNYSWPGNLRELQSVLKKALLQSSGTVLLAASLPEELSYGGQETKAIDAATRFRPGVSLSELERGAIQECLNRTGGNRQQTADSLGISTRTLLRKIREYRLDDPLRPPPSGVNGGASPR